MSTVQIMTEAMCHSVVAKLEACNGIELVGLKYSFESKRIGKHWHVDQSLPYRDVHSTFFINEGGTVYYIVEELRSMQQDMKGMLAMYGQQISYGAKPDDATQTISVMLQDVVDFLQPLV